MWDKSNVSRKRQRERKINDAVNIVHHILPAMPKYSAHTWLGLNFDFAISQLNIIKTSKLLSLPPITHMIIGEELNTIK